MTKTFINCNYVCKNEFNFLKISASKTSLAVRRRLHFLMRNPTFKAKYQYYLHDAVNDTYVQTTFVVSV